MKKDNKIPQGNPFKVPENYFRDLSGRILASTSGGVSGQVKEVKKRSIYITVRPFIAVAAAVAVLAILTFTALKVIPQNSKMLILSEIPLEDYPEMILEDVDITSLEEDVLNAGINSVGPDFDKDEIVDYLVFENVDINLINDQL